MTKKEKINWMKLVLKGLKDKKVIIDFYPCTLYVGNDDVLYCDYNGKTFNAEKDFDAVIINNLYSTDSFGLLTNK